MNDKSTVRKVASEHALGPDRILGAIAYLQQCQEEKQPFAVIIGAPASGKAMLVHRFLQSCPSGQVAHVQTPTSCPHEFLETILSQFGFEPFDSSEAELLKLATVYLRHEAAHDRLIWIAVEETENLGPRVLELIQRISDIEHEGKPAVLFLLTGTKALHRVLDSAGMLAVSARSHERFSIDEIDSCDLDAYFDKEAADQTVGQLVVSLEGNVIQHYTLDRERMIIGRNELNDIPVSSRFVSRHHAVLVNKPQGSYLIDLKSTNGTYVNSTAVTKICTGAQ